MNGILPLWKPSGMTSHDCVMKIRKLFHTKKVGHTGTLDPEVVGVLPICIGQATKIVPFLTNTTKTYVATVKLGSATDTEDATGTIIEEKKVSKSPARDEILHVLNNFKGMITQIPPMYSAVKVNGKKLYEYARMGKVPPERPKRNITIYEIELLSKEMDTFQIRVVCSKGTYIRTLCVDIGKALGYPAHMQDLVRTETGTFTKKNSITFDMIEEAVVAGRQDDLLAPIVSGLSHLDTLHVDGQTKERVLYGQKLSKPDKIMQTDPFVVMHNGQLLAIYQNHPENEEQIKPVRVFSE
ncbi:tRNA pseudouridine(55) synthase TruB [Oceanobacillus bengalensis]|uniref:tRNA pseudouridine synthase B n=1 Tax=Oceanobacillus bengalensis TaxID=1435466 RepID=A0A494Z4U1_9BACI|nr:tRNA pseudouridine(55) synthase TruB [Oceanobacillus bengalensis]RKQ17330.1 tRNA pseudouridine(55) synthase TruB [Oceanobacillus bengalensis]